MHQLSSSRCPQSCAGQIRGACFSCLARLHTLVVARHCCRCRRYHTCFFVFLSDASPQQTPQLKRQFTACSLGLPHIVHWRPNFRNSDSHRCTEPGSVAQVPGSVAQGSVQSTTHHCNSLHNCPGSHRTIRLDSFLLHILHSSRAQSPALVPGSLAWAPALASEVATGTNQSVPRKRSGKRPIRRDRSASSKWVCSPHHRDNPRAARPDRSLACSADMPNPATAC